MSTIHYITTEQKNYRKSHSEQEKFDNTKGG